MIISLSVVLAIVGWFLLWFITALAVIVFMFGDDNAFYIAPVVATIVTAFMAAWAYGLITVVL